MATTPPAADKYDRTEPPPLLPPDAVDPLGGYVQRRFDSNTGYQLATYEWTPPCGLPAARGMVFLLHGILGHTTFEWLSPDDDNHRVLLKDSLVERLMDCGLLVIGYDHPGHGRSTGLHCYIDSHDELRDAAIDVVQHYSAQHPTFPKIMIAMSMGGTTAIRVCQKMPNIIDSYLLLSPAVAPPDNMFGWQGKFLKFISPILAATVPKLPVLSLPPAPDPVVRDATEKDGLVHKGPLRVRTCIEFLRVYSEINEQADQIKFNSVAIFVGHKDMIVSPAVMREFLERISSNDKHLFEYEQFGHDIFREVGTEIVIDKMVEFVKTYLDSKPASKKGS